MNNSNNNDKNNLNKGCLIWILFYLISIMSVGYSKTNIGLVYDSI